jgi:hypothetical protein
MKLCLDCGRVQELEAERDKWKAEALRRRERKVLCEQLEAENERLREMLEDLIHMLDGAGMKALVRKLRTEMPNSRDNGGGGNRTRVSAPTEPEHGYCDCGKCVGFPPEKVCQHPDCASYKREDDHGFHQFDR